MDNHSNTQRPLIFERIAAIMAEVPAIGKNKQNQEQHYWFRGIDNVYNSLHPLFVKYQVFTTSEILSKNREVWTNKNGTIMIEFTLQVKYRFTAIDGSSIETETMGQAMDSSDKASNKAMSMAHKAAILQIFMIPTVDLEEPDASSPEPQSHGYQQPPAQQQHYSEPRTANPAPTQQNGYNDRARQPQEYRPPVAPQVPQPQPQPQQQPQENGYSRNGQQPNDRQPNDRPASVKSLQYLSDLTGRPKVTEAEANKIADLIQRGLTADQCSGLIDSLNAYLQGNRPSIFQEAARTEQHYQPQPQHQQAYDEMPF